MEERRFSALPGESDTEPTERPSGPPEAKEEGKKEPWIETSRGGWFFVNAVLVAPELVVLFPLTLGWIVTGLAPERSASPYLDTIPFVASKALPYVGWGLVLPIWTTLRNLRMEPLLLPRLVLVLFLLLHLSFLGYTVWSWVG